MSLLCRMFGHRPPSETRGAGWSYMDIKLGTVDGIGRQHAFLYGTCPRCEQDYLVGRTHVPQLPVSEPGESP
jgi:hypothetical protein